MQLLVVSSAPFIYKKNAVFAYSPYVDELGLWQKNADQIMFCCPTWKSENGLLVSKIEFDIKTHFRLIDFNLNTFLNVVKAIGFCCYNFFVLFKAMFQADHLHIRCPGNIGLLASFVQLFFPFKPKTVKYAGNWDPKSNQPWSYRMQKWILSNTLLSHNIQILVYGEWDRMTKNCKPFFTASYKESDKVALEKISFNQTVQFLFVGMLVSGKNPMYAIQLIESLYQKGFNVTLSLYGEGNQRAVLEQYVEEKKLGSIIFFKGNQEKEVVRLAYQNAHFLILPSESEGWPKVVAEAMFWGCIPIASKVSCVPYMLDFGKRGCILTFEHQKDTDKLISFLENENDFQSMRNLASAWSRNYTIDVFENQIKTLLLS